MLRVLANLFLSDFNIYAQAHVCDVAPERDGHGVCKWVLPYASPCRCSSVRLGGMNTRTPIRPLTPVNADTALVSADVAAIRKHYGFKCKGNFHPIWYIEKQLI